MESHLKVLPHNRAACIQLQAIGKASGFAIGCAMTRKGKKQDTLSPQSRRERRENKLYLPEDTGKYKIYQVQL